MMFAVIRVRGTVDKKKEINATMKMMRLTRVNHCVIVRKEPQIEGMIKKVKDFVTWGEISEATLEKLVAARGRMEGDKKLDEKAAKDVADTIKKQKNMNDIKGFKPLFRLSPPRKGYEGIKRAFPKGALGYRGDKINKLIERMM
ncbi:MAG: 50S ribosomal protein L30 [Candidatus Aenigmarchaeota archaeon]|nr:50S ribosomal protein L30 [Candidatus Aenigmarchaeota archaeon]